MPFAGFGIHKVTISDVHDYADHVKLFASPVKRFADNEFLVFKDMGHLREFKAVFSVPRDYSTLTAEGHRIYKETSYYNRNVRLFEGDTVSTAGELVPVIGMSIVCHGHDLFNHRGYGFVIAEYETVTPPSFKDDPYMELISVRLADRLKF